MAEDAGSIYAEVRIRLNNLDNDVKQATARLDGLEKTAIEGTGKASKQASANMAAIGVASVAMSAVVIGAFRALITSSVAYSEALSGVQAATRGSAEELDALAVAAEGAGKQVSASSAQSLGAIEGLAKAGVSTADIMGGALTGALTLAAAGEMEVADAAEIAAATMTQFDLAGADVVHIADLLAAGAGKAQGEVSDLSMALKQAGLVASQTGLSVDDTVGSLAAFASAGLLGSDAGTSFRTMLLRLTPQSKEAAEEMKRLGLNAFDAQGEFIGITKFAGQLQTQLSGLTTEQRNSALATIFGSDSIRAANVLYTQGAEGISEWISKVNDTGFAAETARIKLDNLSGDLKKLDAQIATSSAKIGGSLDPTLRGLAQAGTAFLDFLDEIPAPLAAFAVTIASLAAGAGLLTGALSLLGVSVAAITGPIGLAVIGITALTGGAIAAGNAIAEAGKKADETRFGKMVPGISESAKELEEFAKKARKAEDALQGKTTGAAGNYFSKKTFEDIAVSMGLTNDQLARVALSSDRVSGLAKLMAKGFLDAKVEAELLAESAKKVDGAWGDFLASVRGTPTKEIKPVQKAIETTTEKVITLADQWAYFKRLSEGGALSQEEEIDRRIKALEDEISKLEESGLKEGKNVINALIGSRAILAGLKSRKQAYVALRDEEDKEAKEAIATQEEVAKAEKDRADSRSENTKKGLKDSDDLAKKEIENAKLATNSILDSFSGLATALGDIFAGIYQRQIDDAERAYDLERELIENNGMTKKEALEKSRDDAIATGDAVQIADAQRALALYNLEADYTKKKAQLEYDAAMVAWRLQIALATAQAAQAVLNAYSSGVATPFIGPATGAIFAGIAAGIGSLQIGAIIASQPQAPAFATGGIVLPSGSGGKQVTVADKGGGELMFGTGALGQPLMQGFADLVASKVTGGPATIQIILDGRMIAESTVNFVDNGIVKMRSLTR